MANSLAVLGLVLAIIISIALGYFVHKLFHKWVKRNWLAFLLSLLGIFPLIFILVGIGRLLILRPITGPVGLGEALGIGIAMALFFALFIAFGIIIYLATIISIYHWVKKKKKK